MIQIFVINSLDYFDFLQENLFILGRLYWYVNIYFFNTTLINTFWLLNLDIIYIRSMKLQNFLLLVQWINTKFLKYINKSKDKVIISLSKNCLISTYKILADQKSEKNNFYHNINYYLVQHFDIFYFAYWKTYIYDFVNNWLAIFSWVVKM